MKKKKLYLFVEGPDDIRFFQKVIVMHWKDLYDIEIIQYANQLKEKINNFLKTIKSNNDEYLYISDLDAFPCITKRKAKIIGIHTVDKKNIKIANKMIESWYLAGINNEGSTALNIWPPSNTEIFGKIEIYRDWKPMQYVDSLYLIELLKFFSIEFACKRNHSFRYLMDCLNKLKRSNEY